MKNISGWLIVDKPEGITSAQVVAKIKRLYQAKKVGHGGTLDPLATGVLPIALGEATKTISFILDGEKSYRFQVRWGESTTTDDSEGSVTATSDKRPGQAEIQEMLHHFQREIQQTPPIFSALKVEGKRAYALARKGEEVILAARKVVIKKLVLLEASTDTATFEVTCSKGTYVRSLARDMALELGTYGHIIQLRRIKAGPFSEKNAILLDSLLQIGHNTELMSSILPLQVALADILALEIGDVETLKLRQGQHISVPHRGDEEVMLVTCEGKPQALAKIENGMLIPIRVFNID